jgi:hypothetical protein
MKETSWSGLRYEVVGCQVPSMGHWMSQLLATLCVALSVALVALSGSDQTQGVLPSNPMLWQTPRQSWGPF